MEPINLNPSPQTSVPKINLSPVDAQPPPVDEQTGQQRAVKASIGLPGYPKTEEQIRREINIGNEGSVRQEAAAFVDQRKEEYRQRLISQFSAAKQGQPMTPDEEKWVNNFYKHKTSTDPKSVFEEYYPLEFLESLRKEGDFNENTPWKDLTPKEKDETLFSARDVMTKQQILNTLYDEGKNNLEKQSWLGWSADRAKEWLIPGYWQLMACCYDGYV